MNKIMKILILLSMFFIIASASATDIYKINDVRNLETSIHMQDRPLNAYIDYRDVDEAPSGGYFEESKELLLPHDLGLGKHRLEIETENGIKGYDFYVVKGDEDISIYKDYTPYYYEDGFEDMIDDDYQAFMELGGLSNATQMQDNQPIGGEFSKNYIKVNISLGNSIIYYDDSLTSKEIGGTIC